DSHTGERTFHGDCARPAKFVAYAVRLFQFRAANYVAGPGDDTLRSVTPSPGRRTGVIAAAMKALVLRRHGGLADLEVVDDYPVPAVKDGHVVIRVRASSFNYHDVFTVHGMPGIKVPLPVVIGLDMAGEIVETGGGVSGRKPGDRVLINPVNKARGL